MTANEKLEDEVREATNKVDGLVKEKGLSITQTAEVQNTIISPIIGIAIHKQLEAIAFELGQITQIMAVDTVNSRR